MTAFYQTFLGALYSKDCVEFMAGLPDGVIDLTVTSPPYDQLRNYENTSAAWSFEKFQRVAEGLHRVTKKGGVVVWVVGDSCVRGSETGTSFKQALYFMKCGFSLHDTMIYQADKAPLTHNRYEQAFEYMFVLSKGRPSVFNPIRVPCKQKGGKRKSIKLRDKEGVLTLYERKNPRTNDFKIKNNIWKYATGRGGTTNDAEAFQHPAVFPEELAKDHIESWSNAGDLVLDPFCGSGTVPKMCELTGRRWLASESVPSYCQIVASRVEKYKIGGI